MKVAAKARTPLSKFIIETVDSVIDENEEFKPRREMVRDMEALNDVHTAVWDLIFDLPFPFRHDFCSLFIDKIMMIYV